MGEGVSGFNFGSLQGAFSLGAAGAGAAASWAFTTTERTRLLGATSETRLLLLAVATRAERAERAILCRDQKTTQTKWGCRRFDV
jgi:hypothetical protein